jgi:hypothetical protein
MSDREVVELSQVSFWDHGWPGILARIIRGCLRRGSGGRGPTLQVMKSLSSVGPEPHGMYTPY